MAADLARKRKRAHVSYREPSSNDDFSNSDIENLSRRKRPTRRSARHQSQEVELEAEPSTRQPQRTASPILARSAAALRAHRRKGKSKISYREETTDDDGEEEDEADYEPEEVVVQRKPRSKPTSGRSTPRKQSDNGSRRPIGHRKRALGAPLKEKKGRYIPSYV
jgi:hypothetical protein